MPIARMNNITMQNITDVINISSGDPVEFLINVNTIVFDGWFFFILLWILAIILYMIAQTREDQPLVNMMYVMALCTILSFILRLAVITKYGVEWGLLTDWQMWIFPIVTVILAGINRFTST